METAVRQHIASLVVGVLFAALAAAPALAEARAVSGGAPVGTESAEASLPAPSSRLDFLSPAGTIIPTAGGCSATASCEQGSDVSCSMTSTSGTCSFQDQDCSAGRQGFVKCGSTQRNCDSCGSSCPSPCTSDSQCSLIACCPSGYGECQPNGTCDCLF